MYKQNITTAVCLWKCTSGGFWEENAYLGDQKHESIWKIISCSDVVLHLENAHFNLETNWLLDVSGYTYVCDIIQFVQIIVITVNTN